MYRDAHKLIAAGCVLQLSTASRHHKPKRLFSFAPLCSRAKGTACNLCLSTQMAALVYCSSLRRANLCRRPMVLRKQSHRAKTLKQIEILLAAAVMALLFSTGLQVFCTTLVMCSMLTSA